VINIQPEDQKERKRERRDKLPISEMKDRTSLHILWILKE
jgi:hypothetical protein